MESKIMKLYVNKIKVNFKNSDAEAQFICFTAIRHTEQRNNRNYKPHLQT